MDVLQISHCYCIAAQKGSIFDFISVEIEWQLDFKLKHVDKTLGETIIKTSFVAELFTLSTTTCFLRTSRERKRRRKMK